MAGSAVPALRAATNTSSARALAREIERLGGGLFEASPARGLAQDGAIGVVSTGGGEVRAKDVVIACGGYTGALEPRLRRSYLPIATYVMLTKPDKALIGGAIRPPAPVGDGRGGGDQHRPGDGGARLPGGGENTPREAGHPRPGAVVREMSVAT